MDFLDHAKKTLHGVQLTDEQYADLRDNLAVELLPNTVVATTSEDIYNDALIMQNCVIKGTYKNLSLKELSVVNFHVAKLMTSLSPIEALCDSLIFQSALNIIYPEITIYSKKPKFFGMFLSENPTLQYESLDEWQNITRINIEEAALNDCITQLEVKVGATNVYKSVINKEIYQDEKSIKMTWSFIFKYLCRAYDIVDKYESNKSNNIFATDYKYLLKANFLISSTSLALSKIHLRNEVQIQQNLVNNFCIHSKNYSNVGTVLVSGPIPTATFIKTFKAAIGSDSSKFSFILSSAIIHEVLFLNKIPDIYDPIISRYDGFLKAAILVQCSNFGMPILKNLELLSHHQNIPVKKIITSLSIGPFDRVLNGGASYLVCCQLPVDYVQLMNQFEITGPCGAGLEKITRPKVVINEPFAWRFGRCFDSSYFGLFRGVLSKELYIILCDLIVYYSNDVSITNSYLYQKFKGQNEEMITKYTLSYIMIHEKKMTQLKPLTNKNGEIVDPDANDIIKAYGDIKPADIKRFIKEKKNKLSKNAEMHEEWNKRADIVKNIEKKKKENISNEGDTVSGSSDDEPETGRVQHEVMEDILFKESEPIDPKLFQDDDEEIDYGGPSNAPHGGIFS